MRGRLGKQRAKARRKRQNAQSPRTAAQIAVNLRKLIGVTMKALDNRIEHNAFGYKPDEMLAAFGADADTLTAFLTAGRTLSAVPQTGTSGQ